MDSWERAVWFAGKTVKEAAQGRLPCFPDVRPLQQPDLQAAPMVLSTQLPSTYGPGARGPGAGVGVRADEAFTGEGYCGGGGGTRPSGVTGGRYS